MIFFLLLIGYTVAEELQEVSFNATRYDLVRFGQLRNGGYDIQTQTTGSCEDRTDAYFTMTDEADCQYHAEATGRTFCHAPTGNPVPLGCYNHGSVCVYFHDPNVNHPHSSNSGNHRQVGPCSTTRTCICLSGTFAPTATPTVPTNSPTDSPTNSPSSKSPTLFPTKSPTDPPTDSPTDSPTHTPTDSPTLTPTDSPTTAAPTLAHCINGVKDPVETDVDCGGLFCHGCAESQDCLLDTDCFNGGHCFNNICKLSTKSPTTPTTAPTDDSDIGPVESTYAPTAFKEDKGLGTVPIVGIIIGTLFLIGGSGFFIYRRSQNNKNKNVTSVFGSGQLKSIL